MRACKSSTIQIIQACIHTYTFDWKRIRTHAGNLNRKRFVINKIAKQPTHTSCFERNEELKLKLKLWQAAAAAAALAKKNKRRAATSKTQYGKARDSEKYRKSAAGKTRFGKNEKQPRRRPKESSRNHQCRA